MAIEVFKTSVSGETEASELKKLLLRYFPGSKINFDLQDCDNILRVEAPSISTEAVIMLINERGVACKPLD